MNSRLDRLHRLTTLGFARLALSFIVVLALAAPALAGPRERARRIHDRLVGIPPAAGILDLMAGMVSGGNAEGAALEAMKDPIFYSSTLKNFVTPWTNVPQTVFADLNDYTATVIGMIRDDEPFNTVLSADLVYIGSAAATSVPFSHTDNEHYRDLEAGRVDLSDDTMLIPVPQSSLLGSQLGTGDAAGVITTRAAAEAFFSAGTNRRMWRFISMNYLCRDLEDMKDISRPVDRIRQDVSRSPGGDSSIFHNHCSGCHTGMDPLAGAFAYYEWDEVAMRLIYTPGQVQGKHLINAETFTYGYETVDDRWDNYWREGPNSLLDWRGPNAGGFGAQSLGEEVASSRAFSICQVEKVFQQVCFRAPNSDEDLTAIDDIADSFEQQSYSMKQVFAEVAVYCMGD